MPRLPPLPTLEWIDGQPRATAFDDLYFSREGGLAETDAVFLTGCCLPDAWAGKARFAIGELGFGAGLNALAVWRAWRASRIPNAILHMCSIEAFPLDVGDAARAHASFPEIASLSQRLLARWPVRAYAPQRLWFEDDGFALTVIVADATEALAHLDGRFDAWFLDGFAPARNAAMWSPEIFQHIAARSAPNARLATFTVAGDVRRGLEAAGFKVEKKPGFGAKRERLEAILNVPTATAFPLYPRGGSSPKRVAILGAGVAGAATAAALARRGCETIVLDAAPTLGAGASGNPVALVAPRLDRDASAVSEFFLAAYLAAIAAYRDLDAFTACGLEERPGARDGGGIAARLADPPLPPDWLTPLGIDGIFYPQAGVLRPDALLRALLSNATLMLDAPVNALERADDGWRLLAPDGRALLKADAVVLACGAGLAAFEAANFLPLQFSRGQIEWAPIDNPPLRAVQADGYVAPGNECVAFGATFDKYALPASSQQMSIPSDEASRQKNLTTLTKLAPELAARLNQEALQSRASLRTFLPDHVPVAGLMPNASAWLAQNAGLAHGRAPDPSLPPPSFDGVYVHAALGARGFTLAPLLGELIAAEMFNEPAPLSRRALEVLHPARFLHRALKRRITTRKTAQEGNNGF